IGSVGFGEISVKVIDSLQAYVPIENAEVALYRGSTPFDFASTDDRGLVTFRDVPSGTYSLRAYSKTVGRGGNTGSFTLSTGETEHHEIVLDFLGKVAGFVTDPETTPPNQPSRGIPVQVDGVGASTRASTDSTGSFSILGVPEGGFKIFAYDYDTGRMAFGPDNLAISKVVQEYNDIHLQLERTATLTVKAYLPNDSGGAGELAPLVDVLVEARDYYREAQGNSLTFPKMIPRYGYTLTVKEMGGEYRQVKTHGSFPSGALTHTHSVVFASTGTVEVLVRDAAGNPVSDAQVTINGKQVYTPADGTVRMTMPFGWISVAAKKDNVGASAGGQLQSRSIPLAFTLNLGSSATITGNVEAEEGIGAPSIGTRVLVTVTSRLISGSQRLETRTDANGNYIFSGIPVGGTRLAFIFYGPDDTTIGHEMTIDVPDGTTGTYTIARVKIDATPPRVLAIDPPANSTNVSPSSPITVTFSEAIAASFLTGDYFQIISTADSKSVNLSLQPSVRPDGTFQVKLIPGTPPAGQKYALASNVLYRVSVKQGIQDTTGNALRATFGSSFTTVNYTEPAVVRVEPDPAAALQANDRFRIKFNKAVDITSLDAGYGGVLKVEKLSTRGGDPVAEIQLTRSIDPLDPTVINAAPTGVAIAESSFYRLTVSGIRDTQDPPNTQKDAKVVDFFSYDTRRPIARIKSPVAEGEKLVSGVSYTAQVEVFDEGTETPSIDVESVDWFDGAGKYLKTIATPPYSYTFTAP
ncbi:MAG: Ig-like domain-containing protein, partial [Thermoanaerobaculia bacterium]